MIGLSTTLWLNAFCAALERKRGHSTFSENQNVPFSGSGNPPVRFDQREVETEHGMRLVRHRRGNPDPEYVEAYPTAPPLDSTLSWLSEALHELP